jgi:hypothetical protein
LTQNVEPPPIRAGFTVESFAGNIQSVLRARFPHRASFADARDIQQWLEERWPMPQEAVLCVTEWARAYVSDQKTRNTRSVSVNKK